MEIKEFKMRKFNYNKIIKENTVVHCKTEDQANELLTWADSVGLRWVDGESYLGSNNYNEYGDKTCYYLFENGYGDLDWCIDEDYKVIPFEEALLEEPKEILILKDKIKELEEELTNSISKSKFNSMCKVYENQLSIQDKQIEKQNIIIRYLEDSITNLRITMNSVDD